MAGRQFTCRTCREYWHEGAGIDKHEKNHWNRYEIVRKNDEQLIKMATIIQRVLQTETTDGDFSISDDEKEQLLEAMRDLNIDKGEK